jgi:arylsulfatase A-like enzyme
MTELDRRSFLQAGGLALPEGSTKRPNVVIIMADQLRYDCLGANGNRIIRTPNLDRLAGESANFSQGFVQAPVCVPSRISFFTGRYPHSHKNRVNYTPCDEREVLLQKLLRDTGYQTGSVGKLHYYPPTAEHARTTGFDRVLLDDGVAATDPYSDYVKWRNQNDPNRNTPYLATAPKPARGGNPFRGAIPYEFTPTHWTGEQSCRMLREFAAGPKPFFLFCSFFKPHAPYTVPEPYDSMYNGMEIPLPERVSLEEIQELPLPLQKQILRFTPQYNMDRARLQWIWRSYYASVSMVDYEAGRILEELERSGRSNDTVVVFSSDHGDQLLEHGLVDKNVFFESSVRVPLLIRMPGRIQPHRHGELVEMIDVLPTVLELCGIPAPANAQGRSFARLTGGGAGYRPREMVFAENVMPEVITGGNRDFRFVPGEGIKGIRHPDAKMVRTRRWKLNYYPGHGGELYDLVNDPGETRNLYEHPERKGTVTELKELLLDWMISADENDQIAPRWLL